MAAALVLPAALVLIAGLLLALVGGWGTLRLLGRLALTPAERLALTLALFPALLGEAAFLGLLIGRAGPLLPAGLCMVLGAAGWLAGRMALTTEPGRPGLTRRPARQQAGEREQSSGVWGVPPPAKMTKMPKVPVSTARERESGSAWAPVALGAALYAAGTLGTTLLTPLSAGALRIGDWVAHWFLVVVYLGQPLPDLRTFTNRVGDFGVISRPPLYNLEGGLLVGALAWAPGGTGEIQFWPFQLLTPLLALGVAGAGVLWARAIGGAVGERAAWVVAGLIGLSPFLLQNASYPWSKMVAGGLVLLFLYLIRAAALAQEPTRSRQAFVLAAVCAGLAYFAHQTTLFYALPTLLWLAWRRPRPLFRWRPTSALRRPLAWTVTTWALGGVAGLAAFMPWQAWVLATYGLRAALEANPASFGADVTDTLGDWLLKGAVAALGTLVPLPALTALARGAAPSLDQLLRVQLALLTGALGVSGCWLLLRELIRPGKPPPQPLPTAVERGVSQRARLPLSAPEKGSGGGVNPVVHLLRRPPWLALVVACGFLGQVMLQPNWHDTGDAAESMTPIVILALACVARAALSLGPGGRRLFMGLVLAELALYLGLWLWWAFGAAWTRDPNTVLASRYGLDHMRSLWRGAVPLGALLLATGIAGSAVVLWRSLAQRSRAGQPVVRR